MSRIKLKGGSTPEVNSARSKLDGLLQTLVEKKDDSFSADESHYDPMETSPDLQVTPTKRPASRTNVTANQQAKKRKKSKDEVVFETGQYKHTYVMKLFDRSLDLAQFENETPLYPICRAWMHNQPHNRNLGVRSRSPTPERDSSFEDEGDKMPTIYSLPQPLKPGGPCEEVPIPDPVTSADAPLDINAPAHLAPQPEKLLLDHLDRWKKTRQRWKEYGFKKEENHAESLNLIKYIYDKQAKE